MTRIPQAVLEELNPLAETLLLDEKMALHTHYRIGGPVDLFLGVEKEKNVLPVMKVLNKNEIPVTLLGAGTNVLVSDRGIRGAVLTLGGEFKQMEVLGPHRVRAGSAVLLKDLSSFSEEKNIGGFECESGVPGSIGGAALMNAGTWGEGFGDFVESLRVITPDLEERDLLREDCGFAYRTSRFQEGGWIILSCVLAFEEGKPFSRARFDKLIDHRAKNHPGHMPCAGSTFRNPEGTSAAKLIEAAGLKGTVIGGAQISEQHANFIVNLGGASAGDVRSLIRLVQQTVKEKFGEELRTEVIQLGEF